MIRLTASSRALFWNTLMYCAGFGLFLCASFALLRLLIPGELDVAGVIRLATVSMATLAFVCWWAGDFWRRILAILLLVASATLYCVGVGVLIGVAFSDWKSLSEPLAIKGILSLTAAIGCWYLASRIEVRRKVIY
jgi:hypothetical protein